MPKRACNRGNGALKRLKRTAPHDSEDDSVHTSSSSVDDSEGSLAQFIEHDSAELDDDPDAPYSEEHGTSDDDCSNDDEAPSVSYTEEDPDDLIARQYTSQMEMAGSVIMESGVRRSMRANKGKAPTRYVDEDYATLMLEDVSPEEQAELFTTSDEEEEEEAFNDTESDSADS